MSTTSAALVIPTAVGTAPARRPAVLRAELLRHHRTFTWGASLVALGVALFCVRLAAAATARGLAAADGRWDGNVLGWLSFYPVAVLLPLGALMGALARTREARWREGGTTWRDVSTRSVLLARLGVLALACLTCQATVLAPVLVQSLLTGEGWGPVGTWSALAALWTLSQSAAAAWGLLLARLVGPVSIGLAPAAALAWSVGGALQAESSRWLIRPWTWYLRGQLPLLGVHGSSVNLAPGDAAWCYPVWPSAALTAAVGALAVVLLLGPGERRGAVLHRPRGRSAAPGTTDPVSTPARTPVPRRLPAAAPGGRTAPVRALAPALPWLVWAALAALLLALLLVVRFAYSPSSALPTLALVGLPVAATTVGTMTWRRVAEPWRLLVTRIRPVRLVAVLAAAPSAVLGLVLLAVGAAAAAGEPLLLARADAGGLAGPVYALATIPFVTTMLVAVSMAVTQWLGLGASVALGVVGLLDSLVIDGNEVLTAALWRWAPWGWAAVAGRYPGTWAEIVVLSAGMTAVAMAALVAGARRAARA